MSSRTISESKSEYYMFYDYLRQKPPIKLGGSWLLSKYEDIEYILSNHDLFRSNRIDILFDGLEGNNKINFAKKSLETWILHQDKVNTEVKMTLAKEIYAYFNSSMIKAISEKLEICYNNINQLDYYDFRKMVAIPLVSHLLMDILKVKRIENIEIQEKLIFQHMQNIAVLITRLNFTKEEAESISQSLLYIAKLGENYDGVDDNFKDSEYTEEYSVLQLQKGAVYHAFIHDTVNFLCNTLYVLEKNKHNFELKNIVPAIEEAIRLEPPVQALVRTANQDFTIRNQKISKDDIITLFIASANRDEEAHQLDDLDDFVLGRKIKHLNFGHGIHACIGQHLAKQIVKDVMEFYFSRCNFEVDKVVWDDHLRTYRNMDSIQIKNIN